MTIFELRDRSRQLDPERIRREAILEHSSEIIKDFQNNQLGLGFISQNGVETRVYYRDDDYAAFKKYVVNPSAEGYVDLKFSGDLYRGMYYDNKLGGGEINSHDYKTDKLRKKYGNFFELSDKTANRNAMNYIVPSMAQKAKQILGL